ncbi:nose resistant to fluoxetine protein 6-like [Centruroides vittatus]|uniref:nose resistant to fluoxetine protein 6-like n=1 Tax=Centruroides vittatus TaxID=120091 RepID=UPI00350F9DE1
MMWKIFPSIIFIFKLVQSLDIPNDDVFNYNSINELNNLQKDLLRVISTVPEYAIVSPSLYNSRLFKGNKTHQIVDFNKWISNVTTENVLENNTTDRHYDFKDIKSLAANRTGSKCNMDLIYLMFSFSKDARLQMLDAAGKPPSGLKKGNSLWLGDFKQCREVTVPLKVIDNMNFGNFKGKYCYLSSSVADQNTMNIGLKIGICVPDSCNEEILSNDLKELSKFLIYIPWVKKVVPFINSSQITCQNSTKKWESGEIVYMCVICIFAFFIVVGTLCDIIIEIKKYLSVKTENKSLPENYNPREYYDESETNNESELIINRTTAQQEKTESAIVKFLICFSLYTNGVKILSTENTGSQLQCVHGIRFLSMCWIVLGHTFLSALTVTENLVDYLDYVRKFSALFIVQATYSVDTFFLLSGLLLSYLFLKNYEGSSKKFNWAYYYLHRIWRLTPVYMMLLGLYTTIFLRMGNGPLWPKEADNGKCKNYWWRNLLYIQNLEGISEMCMAWTWYLANDMQFYIISPIFLILLWKFPVIGFVVMYVALGISSITTGILATNENIISIYSWMDANGSDGPNTKELTGNFFDDIYDKPYCRIGPYLIGIATGYALHKMNYCKSLLNKTVLAIGWIVAIALSSSVIFGIYHTHLGVIGASVYNAFSRTTWSIAVAWVIFVCLAGYGGVVNSILSWKAWTPLSRLTYAAYLVHPIVIAGYYGSLIKPIYFQMDSMITYYLGILMSSYLAAFVVSVVFESPMMALEKFILEKMKKE